MMTNRRLAFAIGACVLGAVGVGSGCRGETTGNGGAPSVGPSYAGEDPVDVRASKSASNAVAHAQQTFKTRVANLAPHSVLTASPVDGFTADGTSFHAVGPAPRKPSMTIDARIPRFADGVVSLNAGGLGVESKARGLAPKSLEWAQKIGVYADVQEGVTAYRRVDEHGVEDLFEVTSPRSSLSFTYDVTLKNVAGLRLVGGSLELLDASGTPRLAMPAPVVYDAHGVARMGSVSVEGCAFDTNPNGPWNRPVTAPGSSTCVVTASIDGEGLTYPVLVDPVWRSTTTDTKQTHAYHHMFLLPAGADAGKVLLVGGTGTAPRQTEIFDPTSETWTYSSLLSADFGPGNGAAVLASGVVVIAGGYPLAGAGTALKTALRRDATTGTWSSAAAMKNARTWHAMTTVTIGGVEKVLAAGGTTSDSATNALKSAELYDPTADTWTTTGAMVNFHQQMGYAKLSTGKVLVAGGYTDGFASTSSSDAEIFDPATSTWTSATMKASRGAPVAVPLAGGAALVAGGEDFSTTGSLNSGEIWDGSTFTLLASTMTQARKFPSGVLLPDGRALITGGTYEDTSIGTSVTTQTSELFDPGSDPKTGTFIATSNMGSPRIYHAMVALAGKGALCTGGLDDASTGTELSLSEIYDTTLGAPCGSGCPSGTFCTEGVCCKSASCPTGETCAAPGHEGICAKPKGATCTTGSECATGNCVESVCCDAPCGSQCQTCTATGKVGTCTAAAVGTDPGGKCAAGGFGDPTCGPFCDSTGGCFNYATSGTPCGAAAEAGPDGGGSFCTRDQCDGFGSCTPSTYNCGLTCTTTVTCSEATKTCTADSSGIKAGYCVIDGACWTYGDIDPSDSTHCRQCNPPVSKTGWFDSCAETGPDTGVDTGVVDSGVDAKADAPSDTKADAHDAGADTRDAAPLDTGVVVDSSAVDSDTNPGDSLPSSSACGCEVPGGSNESSTHGALLAAAGLAFVVARRRRK